MDVERSRLENIKSEAEYLFKATDALKKEKAHQAASLESFRLMFKELREIVFGKESESYFNAAVIEEVRKAFSSPVTELERQVVESEHKAQKAQNELREFKESYDRMLSAFGRLQETLLGRGSTTETFDDLQAPAEDLIKFRNYVLNDRGAKETLGIGRPQAISGSYDNYSLDDWIRAYKGRKPAITSAEFEIMKGKAYKYDQIMEAIEK